ncbi:hypothetical protein [Cohnella algarum]|uniref:hypothetical protein n=1 Tax=Cohnella algarum TaxID=2044859 RepID=UPI0019671FC2|nr:hypothetical protein [Cohnella algarum]MBN2982776.1 hypothetical protein [Cohnella algarum]
MSAPGRDRGAVRRESAVRPNGSGAGSGTASAGAAADASATAGKMPLPARKGRLVFSAAGRTPNPGMPPPRTALGPMTRFAPSERASRFALRQLGGTGLRLLREAERLGGTGSRVSSESDPGRPAGMPGETGLPAFRGSGRPQAGRHQTVKPNDVGRRQSGGNGRRLAEEPTESGRPSASPAASGMPPAAGNPAKAGWRRAVVGGKPMQLIGRLAPAAERFAFGRRAFGAGTQPDAPFPDGGRVAGTRTSGTDSAAQTEGSLSPLRGPSAEAGSNGTEDRAAMQENGIETGAETGLAARTVAPRRQVHEAKAAGGNSKGEGPNGSEAGTAPSEGEERLRTQAPRLRLERGLPGGGRLAFAQRIAQKTSAGRKGRPAPGSAPNPHGIAGRAPKFYPSRSLSGNTAWRAWRSEADSRERRGPSMTGSRKRSGSMVDAGWTGDVRSRTMFRLPANRNFTGLRNAGSRDTGGFRNAGVLNMAGVREMRSRNLAGLREAGSRDTGGFRNMGVLNPAVARDMRSRSAIGLREAGNGPSAISRATGIPSMSGASETEGRSMLGFRKRGSSADGGHRELGGSPFPGLSGVPVAAERGNGPAATGTDSGAGAAGAFPAAERGRRARARPPLIGRSLAPPPVRPAAAIAAAAAPGGGSAFGGAPASAAPPRRPRSKCGGRSPLPPRRPRRGKSSSKRRRRSTRSSCSRR